LLKDSILQWGGEGEIPHLTSCIPSFPCLLIPAFSQFHSNFGNLGDYVEASNRNPYSFEQFMRAAGLAMYLLPAYRYEQGILKGGGQATSRTVREISNRVSDNIDVASIAKKWQGSGAYPGIDDWKNITIKKGTKVWGGTPGQSPFYTTDEMMKAAGNDATKLFEGLQVSKGNFVQYRPGMTLYEVTQDITELLQQITYTPDSYGNIIKYEYMDTNRTVTKNVEFISLYNYGFPTKQSVAVTDVNLVASTVATQAEYDKSTGLITKYKDGKNHVTTYENDALGRLKKVTHPDATTIQISYDDTNNIVTRTGETSIKTETRWNPLGWETQAGLYVNGVYEAKSKQGYDTYGRVIWTEDAIANKTNVAYKNEAWGSLIQTTFPDTGVLTNETNVINRTQTSTDAEGNKFRSTLDKRKRQKVPTYSKDEDFANL
jgi:YD repeat-containing protein